MLVMLIAAPGRAVLAADAMPHATLSFDNPVYTDMPVWVHVHFPADHSGTDAIIRYPYSNEPWFFGGNDFEVTLNGKPLPRLKHAGDTPQ